MNPGAFIKRCWKSLCRQPSGWTSWGFGRSRPPALWPARCSRGTNPSWRCNTSARCTPPPSPCAASCTCTAFWRPRGTSGTWGCKWWGWWRCWCRCTSGRRAGTRCCGRAGRWRSWPPPGFGKASTAERRGRPPRPASSLSVDAKWRRWRSKERTDQSDEILW